MIELDQLDRFWMKVKIGNPDECWEWARVRRESNYGAFVLDGTLMNAHRAAWILTNGPIQSRRVFVLHKCDNPPCCNPAHLFLGTSKDNSEDMVAKGRSCTGDKNGSHKHPESRARGVRHGSKTHPFALPRGEKHPLAKLTDADIHEIRRRSCNGELGKSLAIEFRISKANVSRIINHIDWAHVH